MAQLVRVAELQLLRLELGLVRLALEGAAQRLLPHAQIGDLRVRCWLVVGGSHLGIRGGEIVD